MRQEMHEKILKIIYENPGKDFSVRELSKLAKVPRATVHKYLKEFEKQDLVDENNKARENLLFKIKKINFYVENIVKSGLVDEIIKKLNPSCIILFGSVRKGESIKESDIDIFIESSLENKLDLKLYEKRLGHKIQIFIESNINKLNDTLFNNVINGIKLYGSFKIR